jgi:NhaP-type Na+/H+ and K+/H+ antiporter
MIAAISLFIVVFISMLTTRIATIALSHTGLSRESARFQARSALTGSGFTTTESEKVVNHPVRRKIILMLMLIGNAGLVTAVSSLILTFVISDSEFSLISSIAIIVLGVAGIWWAAQSQVIDRFLSRIIDKALRRYTSLDVRDYSAILHLSGDYQITELRVEEEDWIAGKMLKDLRLSHEGVLVLGVQRKKGNFIGTPSGDTKIFPEDVVTVYGRASSFNSIDTRKQGTAGDMEHQASVSEHSNIVRAEQNEDEIEEQNS